MGPDQYDSPSVYFPSESMADAAVKKLLLLGVEETVARNTALFYFDSDVHRGFRHKEYGFQKKNVSEKFAHHVQTAPALWFRNQPSPEERCFVRHKKIIDEAKDDPFLLMTLPMPMAHDYPGGKTEGGAKDYVLISPWQFLNTITNTPSKNVSLTFSTYAKKTLQWPEPDHPWFRDGQPVVEFPRCSLYTHRYNPNAPQDKQHVVLVLDVDGKCCMTAEERSRKDEKAAALIKPLFEGSSEGAPARLDIISSIIKEEALRINEKVKPIVAWHKTAGWKPSWRGYVWGVIFQDIQQTESFVQNRVIPRLAEEHADWYEEGILDKKTYVKGYDRCMGSAKMDHKNREAMRFMQTCPLEKVSNESMVDVFRKCPNEYFLRCLGIIQDPELKDDIFINGLPVDVRKRKRRLMTTSSVDSLSNMSLVERAVADALEEHKLSHNWRGQNKIRVTDRWAEIRPSPDSAFCVFKECELGDNSFEPRIKKMNHDTHSMNNPGMVFRLDLAPDTRDPQKRCWLTQKCWSCGNKTDKANGFQRVCPMRDEVVADIVKDISPKKKDKKEPPAPIFEFQSLCINFEFATIT